MNKKKQSSEKKHLLSFILLAFVLLFFLNLFGFSDNVKNFSYIISEPIQKTFWQKTSVFLSLFENFRLAKDLQEENRSLELKIQKLEVQNVRIFELERENQALREVIGMYSETEFNLIMAEVIAGDAIKDFIRINKGEKNDIHVGDIAVSQNNVLLGRVEKIYRDFSEINLISSTNNAFNAEIVRQEEDRVENISGMVKGMGGLRAVLDLIPREKEVREGDVITTSILGGVFPKGILVGYVKKVQDEDLEPFLRAEIDLAFDIKDINFIFIIRK